MSIIPSRNKTVIIEGEGMDTSQWPVNQIPYRDADGTIKGSGLRMLSSGSLLAPVGFAVESGSVDFGDVLRLSESAGFLAFENLVDKTKYQLLDYAVPRDGVSSKPYYFKLIEAEKTVQATNGTANITTNPLNFEYTTKRTGRTNAMIVTAFAEMKNVRIRISDKASGVAVKYFPSKSAWVDGQNGANLTAGENTLDFLDTALILEANTPLIFDVVADNIALVGSGNIPKFSGVIQEGVFIGVADSSDINLLKSQIAEVSDTFSGEYADLSGIPTEFPPSPHTHPISDVEGLSTQLSTLTTAIQSANNTTANLSKVATTGSYNDLVNKPTLFSGGYADLTGKPVLFDGDYNSLTNKPVIPEAVTRTSQLTNDSGYVTNVTFPVVSVNGKTGSVVLSNTDVGAAATSHTHPISDVTGLQNALDSKASTATLNGYATTASLTSALGNYTTTQTLNTLLSAKFNNPTGTATQYLRGDGTLATFPMIPAAQVNSDWNAVSGAAQILNKPVLFSGSYTDLTNKPTLFSGAYADLTGKPTTFAPSAHTHVIADVTGLQAALDSKIDQAGARSAISLTTTGSGAATYTSSTGVLNIPAPNARVYTNPTRSLNSAFQINTTRDAMVSYSVDITVASLLIGGTSGRVFLEYANEAGFTTGVTVVGSAGNSTGGVLNVTNLGTANLAGLIPAGKFVRLRTANVSGTPTYAFQSAQEVLV